MTAQSNIQNSLKRYVSVAAVIALVLLSSCQFRKTIGFHLGTLTERPLNPGKVTNSGTSQSCTYTLRIQQNTGTTRADQQQPVSFSALRKAEFLPYLSLYPYHAAFRKCLTVPLYILHKSLKTML